MKICLKGNVAEMNSVIEVKNLSKLYKLYNKPSDRLMDALLPFRDKERFKKFYALKDLNFSISSGETVGIIGKNGSGKSTLLKILTGVITQSGGEVKVGGRVSALLELGAGFNPDYTGIENIYLNGTIMGCSREEMDERLDDILNFAEIGDFVYQPVKTYSSGMFVRLAFAVAINVDPEILIVDEALAVGDYRFQAKCYNKFEQLKSMGKTILFVTHDIDAVRRFCTRAVWIDGGRLIMDGEVRDVTSKYMEFITGDKAKLALDFINADTQSLPRSKETTLSNSCAKTEFKPINRYGSEVGAVTYCQTFLGERECMAFEIGDKISICIEFSIPSGADLNSLSLAVSIKNKNGLDLFVTSTYDKGIMFKGKERIRAVVSFNNYLNCGEYTLIAALENRSESPITYYDYIEGAGYFKVVSDKELYGMLQVPSKIDVEYLNVRR